MGHKTAILVAGVLLSAAVVIWFVSSVISTRPLERSKPAAEIEVDRRPDAEPSGANELHPQAVPAALAELQVLQERICRAVRAVQPAVVAVKNPKQTAMARAARHESGGSGVIITPGGLVLSQYHVSHSRNGGDEKVDFKPGDKATVILADGRECLAELLGADRTHDLSLLRLLPPGPYPHVPLQQDVRVQRGDWVLKLGHPMAYRRDRPAPVRLGRVVSCAKDTFVTDCLSTTGDSGGPYFDLDGRLAGVMGIATGDLQKILPENSDVAQRFDQLVFSCTAAPLIHARLEAMRCGDVPPLGGRSYLFELAEGERLPVADWSQGTTTRAKYRSAVEASRASIVAVLNGDVPVALGTVVSADGWVVTKASELPAQPRCRLPGGKVVEARVVGVDLAFDLAILKVEADGMRVVIWADSFTPEAGTLLAAVGSGDLPLAVGVVSVRRRNMADALPPKYSLPLRVPAAPPAIFGKEAEGRGYLVNKTRGSAHTAGIRPGDLLTTAAGRPVRRYQDLVDGVKGRLTGDLLAVEIARAGQGIKLQLPIQTGDPAGGQNYRVDDFPIVFEHDVPLFPHECGGLIVDLTGRAVGITIARVGPHGCMAIPGDCVLRLLPDLQRGKLSDKPTSAR
jgi:serine protease Do